MIIELKLFIVNQSVILFSENVDTEVQFVSG